MRGHERIGNELMGGLQAFEREHGTPLQKVVKNCH